MSANFVPKRVVITNITNANPAVITAAAHGYATDDVITLNVPQTYGMRFEWQSANVTFINVNSFSVNINTNLLDAFAVPTVISFTSAEALPVSAIIDNIAT